jgi:hypothetical protein
MPVYQVTKEDFEPLHRTSFEAEKLRERDDIQKRLRDRPDILEDGLYILAEEFGNWEESNRRIDLLALDSERRLVVIELKRSDDDSLMDLQAIRYAAMVADMTLEQAIAAHRKYLQIRGKAAEDAASNVSVHLSDDAEEANIDSSNPRIILASANFSKELTTSVLWLNRTGIDIKCVKLQPWKTADSLFLESSQVIPIPEAEDYMVRLRNREEEVQQQKEASKVETSQGGQLFGQAKESAKESMKPLLEPLYNLALSLEQEGLAKLSTSVGPFNTVLRVRLPDNDGGFFNVFKNKPGWGYLKFASVRLLDSLAPKSKGRMEQILDDSIASKKTLWELPDGFLEAMADAYREASGREVC